MSILAQIKDDEAARLRRLAQEDTPVSVVIPGYGPGLSAQRVTMTYREAKMLEFELAAVLRSCETVPTSPDEDDSPF